MSDEIGAIVRALLHEVASAACTGRELHDTVRLDGPGLGLDSVARVELLLACEERFGIPFPAALLDEADLTIGRLVEHIQTALAGRAPG